MEIKLYEDWMRPQVISLFVAEYGVGFSEFEQLFLKFYEAPYQQEHSIRIVTVEGEKVGGFQSFFYWPLRQDNKTIHALQSGNSLVHPDFRGKGLFAKMLDYIHQPENNIHFDLLIGFPVEASYNSFIRKNWENPFNLQWYIRPLNPLLSLFSKASNQLTKSALFQRVPTDVFAMNSSVMVEQSKGMDEYRFDYQNEPHFRFIHEENSHKALFEFKVQIRKRIIQEIVIGRAIFSTTDSIFRIKAWKEFEMAIRKNCSASFMSYAINELNTEAIAPIVQRGFRKIDRKIYFIAKAKEGKIDATWHEWHIERGDIDTW
jgi:hypothetical protein